MSSVKYILYTLGEPSISRGDHDMSDSLGPLVTKYLDAVSESHNAMALSVKPKQEYLTLSISNKRTVTLKLEELLATDKKEVEMLIIQAE